jgi:hypothetical protein
MGNIHNISHVYYNTLQSETSKAELEGADLCSERKTGDFEIFEFVLKS